ncbi:hypothetical protein D7M10_07135 [Pseudomonas fluorescens]|nr:hypothetical protein D7M10_07135 [Pseudomonas fluorescens]
MTVNTIGSIANFGTNGVTTNYPFYFKFLANEDLIVTYVSPAGEVSTLTLGTHYIVNGAGSEQGGSVVTHTALAGPGQLVVSREMEAFQDTSLRNQGKFLAEVHENVFDKLTMLIQQAFAGLSRTLRVEKGGGTPTPIPGIALRAGKLLSFDENGNPIVVAADAQSATELDLRLSPISADLTLRVPSAYPSLQAAIERAAVIRTKHQIRVYILIESGHVLASGFKVVDKDLSFVTINSEDPVVTVSPSFNHVSNTDLDLDQVVARTDKIGFLAVRSKMPVWNILVDFSACPTVYGYALNAGSYGYVRSNKGVKNTSHVALNAGSNMVVAGNSAIDAFHAVASGGLISGITVTHRSNANIAEIDASGTAGIGLDVSRGSMVYANISVVSGRQYGIDARRCFIAAQGVTFANCSSAAIRGSIGAKVVAVDAVITGTTPLFNYIMPEQGCDISVSNATVNGSAITDAHVYQSAGINKLTGRGIVTSQSAQDTHPTFFKSGSASRQVSGSPSVTALNYATAFTRAEPGYFAGGVVFGDDVGFRLTCDGAVVIEDVTRVIGGSAKSMVFVPPFSFLASCTLEVYNRGGVTANVAYRLTEYR